MYPLLRNTLALLQLAALTVLHAQTSPERTTTIRFTSWEQPARNLKLIVNEQEYQPVDAPAYRFGQTMRIPHSTEITVHQSTPGSNGSTHTTIPLPQNSSNLRAYLMPEAPGRPLKTLILADDPANFPQGHVRILNFSQHPATIWIGDNAPFTLDPLGWTQIPVIADDKYRVLMKTTLNIEGQLTRLHLDILSLRPGHRGTITLYHTAADLTGPQAISIPDGQPPQIVVLSESEYLSDTFSMTGSARNNMENASSLR